MGVSAGGQSWSVFGFLQLGEQSNASLQWPGPRGTSSGDDGVLPMLSHLGGLCQKLGTPVVRRACFSPSKELD